ncbi:MAG: geranylgeranylglyceryl/heptaprenylglyceryl phosphate synthase [Caldithrix sp.]|nr:MAG: geranylgeranylglyceryl/heptaprenylglyceryl phosphate synthase [Caldithrix sp.]TDI97480.1 MAG: geranylgeranylglyceryl/heptaprenylglyceryl phosphate synthase [Caldithrix sp.]
MTTLERILKIKETKGAGYFVLIDPDKWQPDELVKLAVQASEDGADAILVGGSLVLSASFDELVKKIKYQIEVPLIIFPGSQTQVSKYADAIFFLSLISGRNPTYLIGEQVRAAPAIKAHRIEAISVGYMLIESGSTTSAEVMSNTQPIPRDKPDIAKATAMAAEFMGMKLVYLEAGSGAQRSVSNELISGVKKYVSIPLIVGGGIRTPEEARQKVAAGASFVVTGNVLEKKGNNGLIKEFAEAVHG